MVLVVPPISSQQQTNETSPISPQNTSKQNENFQVCTSLFHVNLFECSPSNSQVFLMEIILVGLGIGITFLVFVKQREKENQIQSIVEGLSVKVASDKTENIENLISSLDKSHHLILFLNFFQESALSNKVMENAIKKNVTFTFILFEDGKDDPEKRHTRERWEEIIDDDDKKPLTELKDFVKAQKDFKERMKKIIQNTDKNKENLSRIFIYNTAPRIPIFILKEDNELKEVYLGFYLTKNLIKGISLKIRGDQKVAKELEKYVEEKRGKSEQYYPLINDLSNP